MSSSLRASDIQTLLKSRVGAQSVEDESSMGPPTCDVVYALFLEPRTEPDPRWTTAEYAIDKAVRFFQPSPALVHCELIVPPVPSDEGLRTQFATYFGAQSGWQTDKADGFNFYLVENSNRWRAVPVFSINAAASVRAECDGELGVQYSLARYLSATPPFRYMANWMSDKRRAPAHCATLTARVLKNALATDASPAHPSSWYGPTTLYHEVSGTANWRGARMGASAYTGMPAETADHVEQLLRGVMSSETVNDVGDEGCMEAVRALTMRVCNTLGQGDAMSQRLTQQQLATALLRWVLLRDQK